MQELDDAALLREYVGRDSEEAFAALVARHVNKVYSVALRHTGNPHSAEEITQAVFVILAKKSRHLGKRVILAGWLYQTARLTAVTFIRSGIRRARREQEACMQTLSNETDPEAWRQIAPLLDAAMAGLNETDRHAVVLRFFDGKSIREVGAALGASEDAAMKRVSRALEKLRTFFARRGVSSTSAIIAGAISAHSVQAAPAALAKSVTAIAVSKGATAGSSTLTLIQGALKIMAWTKAKTAALVAATVILTAGTATIVIQQQNGDRHEPLYQGKAVTAWIEQMYHTSALDMTAHYALVEMGEPAIPYLVRELTVDRRSVCSKEPSPERSRCRSQAAYVLSDLGPKARAAIPAMISALGAKDYQPLRFSGATGLGNIGPAATNAIPALVLALKDDDFNVRMEAAFALAKIGRITPTAVAGLESMLEDRFPGARLRAAIALWCATPDDATASNRVSEFLIHDTNASIRDWAAILLGDLAPATTNFIPALEAASKDSDSHVQQSASSSLKKLNASHR